MNPGWCSEKSAIFIRGNSAFHLVACHCKEEWIFLPESHQMKLLHPAVKQIYILPENGVQHKVDIKPDNVAPQPIAQMCVVDSCTWLLKKKYAIPDSLNELLERFRCDLFHHNRCNKDTEGDVNQTVYSHRQRTGKSSRQLGEVKSLVGVQGKFCHSPHPGYKHYLSYSFLWPRKRQTFLWPNPWSCNSSFKMFI